MPVRQLYGLEWNADTHPLEIEFAMIRAGGYVSFHGRNYGRGKFFHYRQAISLLWPEDDHHRWSDLMLRRKCEEPILVMMGPGDSNKTYSSARYIVTDWFAHSKNTLWLVSSTELRGAELRIWGKVKELFNRARERFPWLPGRILENKTCLTTEAEVGDGREGRLLTKGIIFIPCKRAENWVGLGAYAGIKPTKDGRLGHCGDEVSFMQRSFLQAYSNWVGKPNFQGILQGNPTDTEDPLCVAAQPEDGWSQWEDSKTTQEWRSQWYRAWVIAFDGRNSPNFDHPQDPFPKFPYLIGRRKIQAVADTEGEDSPLFWMQCVGKPRPGAEALKVITRDFCEKNKAFEKVVWQGDEITDVVSLDAAYGGVGGDRCIVMRLRFGRDVEGFSVIACAQAVVVPVSVRNFESPETQIARFVMRFCEGYGVPPSHFFFDGRSTLAVEMARIWSPQVNVVDFGGPATKRPVSQDEYISEQDGRRRLKRCDEHYSKFVTELWFSVRYCIGGHQMRELPKDVAEEGWKRIWRYTKGSPPRIEVETKKEMKDRVQHSPDKFDCLVTGVEGCRRLGFEIRNLREAKALAETERDWLQEEFDKHRKFLKKHELKPT